MEIRRALTPIPVAVALVGCLTALTVSAGVGAAAAQTGPTRVVHGVVTGSDLARDTGHTGAPRPSGTLQETTPFAVTASSPPWYLRVNHICWDLYGAQYAQLSGGSGDDVWAGRAGTSGCKNVVQAKPGEYQYDLTPVSRTGVRGVRLYVQSAVSFSADCPTQGVTGTLRRTDPTHIALEHRQTADCTTAVRISQTRVTDDRRTRDPTGIARVDRYYIYRAHALGRPFPLVRAATVDGVCYPTVHAVAVELWPDGTRFPITDRYFAAPGSC